VNLDKALNELALQLSKDTPPETAVAIGRLVGARIVITGWYYDAGSKSNNVVARIIGVETGRVYTETVKGPGARSNLPELAIELARKIGELIGEHHADLLGAATATRDQRIAKILQSVTPGDRHPVISIHLQEHRGGSRPSATAETELGLIFQRAGFTVVDEHSTQKPDIEISGEVTAEPGARLGALFPCRATINVKVRERATGRILALDRESADASDIGEQTALNSALENAADALAARLVPLLSR
jgi:hypothetical protein